MTAEGDESGMISTPPPLTRRTISRASTANARTRASLPALRQIVHQPPWEACFDATGVRYCPRMEPPRWQRELGSRPRPVGRWNWTASLSNSGRWCRVGLGIMWTTLFDPGRPRSRGSGRFLYPPFGRDRSRIQAGPLPVDQSGFVQFVKQYAVQTPPHSGLLPVPEPPPARHPASEAQFLR